MSHIRRDLKRARDLAFRAAVEPVLPAAWRVLRRSGVSPIEIDDALQTLLVQIHRRWEKLELLEPSELRAYLCCAAAGVAADLGRLRARDNARAGKLEADPRDNNPNPEQLLARKQAEASLDEILLAMPAERRIVFVLYEIEELSGQQIAEHLGLPVGTVASRLRKAREDLERALGRSAQRAGRRNA